MDRGEDLSLAGIPLGNGKIYTMTQVIQQMDLPALIMVHNKTLAAKRYAEVKGFFPENAVEYFISYGDYPLPSQQGGSIFMLIEFLDVDLHGRILPVAIPGVCFGAERVFGWNRVRQAQADGVVQEPSLQRPQQLSSQALPAVSRQDIPTFHITIILRRIEIERPFDKPDRLVI